MSESVKLIVDAYVSLKDRVALEELRQHRQRMRCGLQQKQRAIGSAFNLRGTISLVEDDLSVIESGFERLDDLPQETPLASG